MRYVRCMSVSCGVLWCGLLCGCWVPCMRIHLQLSRLSSPAAVCHVRLSVCVYVCLSVCLSNGKWEPVNVLCCVVCFFNDRAAWMCMWMCVVSGKQRETERDSYDGSCRPYHNTTNTLTHTGRRTFCACLPAFSYLRSASA